MASRIAAGRAASSSHRCGRPHVAIVFLCPLGQGWYHFAARERGQVEAWLRGLQQVGPRHPPIVVVVPMLPSSSCVRCHRPLVVVVFLFPWSCSSSWQGQCHFFGLLFIVLLLSQLLAGMSPSS